MKLITNIMMTALLTVSAQTAIGADLRVRVFERGGNVPLAGVSVCLGTQARLDQLGAKLTDARGFVVFDSLPSAQLLVTASMPGYKSEQELMVTSNANRMLVLSLSGGGGGPNCGAGGPGKRVIGGLKVERFAINNGAATSAQHSVTLNHAASGAVTQYRVSERSDFSDAEWQDHAAAPVFKLSEGNGRKQIWFQVRRHSSLNDAVVETVSPAVSDSIVLRGN
ncbi:MAG: carboxypeptidase-like regulatory domain-containing protein [Gammaproteobacteria bacterium]|nr:carboxypeptidase-like regulatory domain-containing protein [Gammaproteobacteria bacterium]